MGDVIAMKKFRIFSDPTLLFVVIGFAVVSSVATLGTMYGIVQESSVANHDEIVQIRTMFGVLLLVLWLALAASSPRYLCTITLSKTAITVWVPFKKSSTYSYTQFRFIYCGKYFHGNIAGIGKEIWYIVIAQRQLSADELNAINGVPNSQDVVKIRYTEKVVKRLRSILPANHIRQLDRATSRLIVK